MDKDLVVYLEDILESFELVKEYVEGVDEEGFRESRQLQDAVIRRFEVAGEATKQLPVEFREKHPYIPWRQMAGLRDVLIHNYAGVSLRRIWRLIEKELDTTIDAISKIIDSF